MASQEKIATYISVLRLPVSKTGKTGSILSFGKNIIDARDSSLVLFCSQGMKVLLTNRTDTFPRVCRFQGKF